MTGSEAAGMSRHVDLRRLVPMQRHATVFGMVEALMPGEAFVLINDHDPMPLHRQLEARHPGGFTWTYLEQGPQVWRVEIGRVIDTAA